MAKRTRKDSPPPVPKPEPEIDREVAEDFQERQNMSEEGRDQLARKLRNHNQLSPTISAGDVDAAWEQGRESGEETFTGHAPTPDQDQVDEMGAAAGLTYKDDEPLRYGKVAKRDERRWELDPRSGQEEQALDEQDAEDDDDEDAAADADDAPLRFWDLADDLDAEVEDDDDEDDDDEEEEDEEDEEDVPALGADDELEGDEAEIDEDEDDEDEGAAGVDGDDELDSDLDDDQDDDFEEDDVDDDDDDDDDED